MTWIRNPAWDSFWILSAPILGLGTWYFIDGPPTLQIAFILLTINLAHTVSPIALAWSHRAYRAVMLQRPGKFIGWPVGIGLVSLMVAIGTLVFYPGFRVHRIALENIDLREIDVPIVWWTNLFAIWNFYHAGAQNFGIFCLYRRKSFSGWVKKIVLAVFVIVTVLIGHEGGRLAAWLAAFNIGFFFASHWLAAIGLSAHVCARHWGMSPIWFVGMVALPSAILSAMMLVGMMSGIVSLVVLIACLRAGLGMWHFLQDRWIWKLSDPDVRATIGRDLMTAR